MRLLILVLSILSISYSQDSLNYLNHYPVKIGNQWHYSGSQSFFGTDLPYFIFKKVINDTVNINDKIFFTIEEKSFSSWSSSGQAGSFGTSYSYIRVDSLTFNIHTANQYDFDSNIFDSLLAEIGDTLYNENYSNAILNDIYFEEWFGLNRLVREIEIDGLVYRSFRTAENIGVIEEFSGGEGMPSGHLIKGAIINGDTIGTLQDRIEGGFIPDKEEIILKNDLTNSRLILSNPKDGITIVDSIKVKNPNYFYSHVGNAAGYYAIDYFAEGPLYIFPSNYAFLDLYLKDSVRLRDFGDTLLFYWHGLNENNNHIVKIPVNVNNFPTSIIEDSEIPSEVKLIYNYPNPFNSDTKLYFSVNTQVKVEIIIYDIFGKEVAQIYNKNTSPGIHEININLNSLSSGVYFYRMKAGNTVLTRKMSIIK